MLNYVITIICSVVSAMLVFILQSQIKENRRLIKEKESEKLQQEDAIIEGVRQLLSVQLEELYDRYSDVDAIPARAYGRWKKLHKAYKGLHGNGTFNRMDEEMDEKHIDNN